MTAYIVRRLLWLPVILMAVAFITLLLGLYGPGDPAQVLLGQHSNPEVVARVRALWGLDQPFQVQYGKYLWNLLHLDFGESLRYRGDSIASLILPRIWVSVQLASVAIALSLLVGIPIGILAAFKRMTWIDTAAVGLTLVGISVPVFVLGPVLQLFFVRTLHLLPTSGCRGSLPPTPSFESCGSSWCFPGRWRGHAPTCSTRWHLRCRGCGRVPPQ